MPERTDTVISVIMRLADFLKREGISGAEFARRIGVKHPTVSRYLDGQRIPRPEQMQRIHEVTNGEVGPADFYSTQPAAPPAMQPAAE
ncbi:helix-turn-helix domain-containing protein [Marinibaculum pumilum]|uniref:Helix-turn-helix domain-containing protein n=1 Tax=Marinibaculum pumilum TaxID=1766165 RepID=A0ABV7KYE1_9PROT